MPAYHLHVRHDGGSYWSVTVDGVELVDFGDPRPEARAACAAAGTVYAVAPLYYLIGECERGAFRARSLRHARHGALCVLAGGLGLESVRDLALSPYGYVHLVLEKAEVEIVEHVHGPRPRELRVVLAAQARAARAAEAARAQAESLARAYLAAAELAADDIAALLSIDKNQIEDIERELRPARQSQSRGRSSRAHGGTGKGGGPSLSASERH
jgi:hypothetical protein